MRTTIRQFLVVGIAADTVGVTGHGQLRGRRFLFQAIGDLVQHLLVRAGQRGFVELEMHITNDDGFFLDHNRFFDHWRKSLRWQRLKPYETFAELIERHWDGIAAHCRSENKVSLGFVEGLNNKIRVIQRRAYGFRDEEYLRWKILTCMLPEL